jgi:hypothetical protein
MPRISGFEYQQRYKLPSLRRKGGDSHRKIKQIARQIHRQFNTNGTIKPSQNIRIPMCLLGMPVAPALAQHQASTPQAANTQRSDKTAKLNIVAVLN